MTDPRTSLETAFDQNIVQLITAFRTLFIETLRFVPEEESAIIVTRVVNYLRELQRIDAGRRYPEFVLQQGTTSGVQPEIADEFIFWDNESQRRELHRLILRQLTFLVENYLDPNAERNVHEDFT